MSYKLLSENEQSFHILHPDGSDFIVAKKGLDDNVLSKIKSAAPLHFYDGGVTPDPTEELLETPAGLEDMYSRLVSSQSATPQEGQASKVAENKAPSASGIDTNRYFQQLAAAPQPSMSAMPAIEQSVDGFEATPPQTSPEAPLSTQQSPMGESSMGATALGIEGINQEARAVGELGKKNAATQQQYIDDLEKAKKEFDDRRASLETAGKEMYQKVVTGEVKPDRVWQNASVGNKIAAAISIALGGIAGGLNRTNQNVGLDIINKTIDRDIEAQKLDMDKNKNLLALNYEQTRSLYDAEARTRMQMLATVQAQLERNVNLMSSPIAQAKAKQMTGEIMRQAQKLAMENSIGAIINRTSTEGQKEADKEFAKEYQSWTSNGRARVDKNLEKLEAMADYLEKTKNDVIPPSGRFVGRLPTILRSENSLNVKDTIASVMMDSLKETFGGTISDSERTEKIKNAFNETLSPEANLPRLRAEIEFIKKGREAKEKKAAQFGRLGTIRGMDLTEQEQVRRVRVKAPDGKIGTIPASQAKNLPAGYQRL